VRFVFTYLALHIRSLRINPLPPTHQTRTNPLLNIHIPPKIRALYIKRPLRTAHPDIHSAKCLCTSHTSFWPIGGREVVEDNGQSAIVGGEHHADGVEDAATAVEAYRESCEGGAAFGWADWCCGEGAGGGGKSGKEGCVESEKEREGEGIHGVRVRWCVEGNLGCTSRHLILRYLHRATQ
jgi:hypothetical protein